MLFYWAQLNSPIILYKKKVYQLVGQKKKKNSMYTIYEHFQYKTFYTGYISYTVRY